ncbi:MAG: hypothetical protein AAFO07_30275, partial [Bacteroidota bacterium]
MEFIPLENGIAELIPPKQLKTNNYFYFSINELATQSMKAAIFEQFQAPITIQNVADPSPHRKGVVVKVTATG